MPTIDNRNTKTQFRVALIVSRFNEEITLKLHAGAISRLKELDFREEDITTVWVPGAIEIPLVAQRLAKQGGFKALICLGAVIRGETTHYDYVCSQVSEGCQMVSLQNNIPVIFGVLTTENEEQALDRVGGKHGHKGKDAADAAVEMVATLYQIV